MTALEAMTLVNNFLLDGKYHQAQLAVVSIEQERSLLPSSMFERVLMRSLEARRVISPSFENFMRRSYGSRAYDLLVQSYSLPIDVHYLPCTNKLEA